MRVRWPSPCLLNHSNMSVSMRRCTEVLPLGITTRARFQKSSPTAGASGALTRVLLAPRAAFLLIALSEFLTVDVWDYQYTNVYTLSRLTDGSSPGTFHHNHSVTTITDAIVKQCENHSQMVKAKRA